MKIVAHKSKFLFFCNFSLFKDAILCMCHVVVVMFEIDFPVFEVRNNFIDLFNGKSET